MKEYRKSIRIQLYLLRWHFLVQGICLLIACAYSIITAITIRKFWWDDFSIIPMVSSILAIIFFFVFSVPVLNFSQAMWFGETRKKFLISSGIATSLLFYCPVVILYFSSGLIALLAKTLFGVTAGEAWVQYLLNPYAIFLALTVPLAFAVFAHFLSAGILRGGKKISLVVGIFPLLLIRLIPELWKVASSRAIAITPLVIAIGVVVFLFMAVLGAVSICRQDVIN